ncbi:MAG: beta/alpha barrel domain-containing protein [Candidatus Methanospirareceae archaeon]
MNRIGKAIRMERILDRRTRRTVIVPMDHGMTVGLIIHLSASTNLGPDPNHKVLVTSVEDVIKTNYTGTPDTFKEVVQGCQIPVVIAGGPKMNTEHELFEMVYDAIHVGASGVSIGRNVFQAENPTLLIRKISKIVHEDYTVEEAEKIER